MIKLVFNRSDEPGIFQRKIGCLYLQLTPAILFQHFDLQPPVSWPGSILGQRSRLSPGYTPLPAWRCHTYKQGTARSAAGADASFLPFTAIKNRMLSIA